MPVPNAHELRVVLDASHEDIGRVQDALENASEMYAVDENALDRVPVRLATAGFDVDAIVTLVPSVAWAADRWLEPPDDLADQLATILNGYRVPPDTADALIKHADRAVVREPLTAKDLLRILDQLAPLLVGTTEAGDA